MSDDQSEDVDWADTSAFDNILGNVSASEEDHAGMLM